MAGIEWLAGLFEGDGCISILRRSARRTEMTPTYILSLSVTNTDDRLVVPFKKRFGGHIWSCPVQSSNGKPWHKWHVMRSPALLCLRQLLPFLEGGKRLQAQLAMQFQIRKETKRVFQRGHIVPREVAFREMHYQLLRLLKQYPNA